MKFIRSTIVLSLLPVLAACAGEISGPTATDASVASSTSGELAGPAESPQSASACLSGSWGVVDVETYMNSILPPELTAGLVFVDSSGSVSTVFGDDGTYTYTLDGFIVQYTMDIGGGPLPLEVHMDGEGSGIYAMVDENNIRFSDLDNSAVTVSYTLAGEAFDVGMGDASGGVDSAETTMAIDCAGDTLRTYPPIEGALAVEYVRID